MKRKLLTVAFLRSVKPEAKAQRYQDGYGLMLVVRPGGYKGWIQRLVIQGRRRDIGLGSLDRVSLAQARRMAFENRNVAREGGDPTAREEVRTVPNFEAAAEAVIRMHAGTWSDRGKTEARWRATLATYAFPRLGRKSVADISPSDVLAVLVHDGFWNEKRETARKIKQRISTIMDWAVAEGHRADNPCVCAKGGATEDRSPDAAPAGIVLRPCERRSEPRSGECGLPHYQTRFRVSRVDSVPLGRSQGRPVG